MQMKKPNYMVLVTTLGILALSLCTQAVRAAEINVADYNATVTASALNVRDCASTQCRIIGKRYNGQTVRVTHHDGVWRRIVWSAGQKAYVHGAYLRKIGETPGDIDVTDYNATVTASALNIRSGPGIGFPIIGKKYSGNSVRVTHHNDVWRRIVWPGGRRAYAHGSYLRTAVAAPKFVYVALGDSYAAGAGLAEEKRENAQLCERHRLSYPARLNAILNRPTEFVFKACEGHKISEAGVQVLQAQNALARADLVTVTIGGNDLDWTDVIKRCATFWAKLKWSCTHGEGELNGRIDAVVAGLRAFYADLRRRAPRARILIAGYPQLSPIMPKANCTPFTTPEIITPFPGVKINAVIDEQERQMLRRLGVRLNNGLKGIARGLPGVEVVDLARVYNGHEPCTENEWINALRINWKSKQSFHPRAIGHEFAARAIMTQL